MSKHSFPTEIIDLPSRGKVYPENSPLSKGQLEIKYMTAREEDILASQNLIRKGVVLDKLFEAVVVDDDVNIDDIYIGDKNAILLATRILGYGASYKVQVTDPFTGELQKVDVDLSKVQIKEVDESKLNTKNEYEFTLPVSKKKLKFRLLTHKDEREINQEIKNVQRLDVQDGKNKGVSRDVTTRLKYMITEIDGEKDIRAIRNFVDNDFLSGDTKAFRAHVREMSPDIDLKFEFTSDLTGDKETLDIPLDAGFFYPSE